MKKLFLNVLFVIACIQVSAQQHLPNPYASIGKKSPKVATVTNGGFEEFFTKDTLVQIGTTVMNRYTGEVAFFQEENSERFKQFTKHNEKNSRFLSIDPHASSYADWNPYNFGMNNPIYLIDPDGQDPSDFKDKEDKLVTHVEDGSNAQFKQTGKGTNLHYEQVGDDKVTDKVATSVLQEQQKLNISNPALQPGAGGASSHCNEATQCIQLALGNALRTTILTPGRANDVADKIESNPLYKSIDLETANKTAANGGLVLAVYRNYETNKTVDKITGLVKETPKSGHLATFSVGENISKGSLANVGYSKGVTNFVNPTGTAANKWKDAAFTRTDWNNNVKFYMLQIPTKK